MSHFPLFQIDARTDGTEPNDNKDNETSATCLLDFAGNCNATVTGCGAMPAGQASTRTFNVTGLRTSPVPMVYSTAPTIQAHFPGIATTEGGAQAFVSRLVMQTVFDVLESQARSALLPDAVITAILDQLNVDITYRPLSCDKVVRDPTREQVMAAEKRGCIIIGNTVTEVCTHVAAAGMCCMPTQATVAPVPVEHTSVSGTLSTRNIIMATWSADIWRNVVNRALRLLTSGPFG
ncbi:hypothetical protein KIN20_019264 [Parelaphostrongylus tenuis]|uniref:Uncharacterized protein n=1 Tax=Parelaphostrongylus tenuis TaxID=148309 RepID=A0AAD5QQ47_PARTN|nr:hypothetical protein KIN20_019264 [Parelaphostrongylus tenuis]